MSAKERIGRAGNRCVPAASRWAVALASPVTFDTGQLAHLAAPGSITCADHSYEVVSLLGSGGMGDVYRARVDAG